MHKIQTTGLVEGASYDRVNGDPALVFLGHPYSGTITLGRFKTAHCGVIISSLAEVLPTLVCTHILRDQFNRQMYVGSMAGCERELKRHLALKPMGMDPFHWQIEPLDAHNPHLVVGAQYDCLGAFDNIVQDTIVDLNTTPSQILVDRISTLVTGRTLVDRDWFDTHAIRTHQLRSHPNHMVLYVGSEDGCRRERTRLATSTFNWPSAYITPVPATYTQSIQDLHTRKVKTLDAKIVEQQGTIVRLTKERDDLAISAAPLSSMFTLIAERDQLRVNLTEREAAVRDLGDRLTKAQSEIFTLNRENIRLHRDLKIATSQADDYLVEALTPSRADAALRLAVSEFIRYAKGISWENHPQIIKLRQALGSKDIPMEETTTMLLTVGCTPLQQAVAEILDLITNRHWLAIERLSPNLRRLLNVELKARLDPSLSEQLTQAVRHLGVVTQERDALKQKLASLRGFVSETARQSLQHAKAKA